MHPILHGILYNQTPIEQTNDFAKQFWDGLKDKPTGWFDQQIRMACAKAIQGKFGK